MKIKNEMHILTEDLIDEAPQIALDVMGFSQKFQIQLGWHYILDLSCILKRLQDLSVPSRILDAGAGNGLLQCMLASMGHTVVSVDVFPRTAPSSATACVPVHYSACPFVKKTSYLAYRNGKIEHSAALPTRVKIQAGEIEYHQACLDDLACLESGEFDAVISVSALEHNSPEKIPKIMSELRRTAKCGALMLLTISTSPKGGEHRPSHSWLLTEDEIVKAYSMPDGYITNFAHMAQINQEMQTPSRMHRWLASSYYRGGDNGMPWGKWAPQYLPMALAIINAASSQRDADCERHAKRVIPAAPLDDAPAAAPQPPAFLEEPIRRIEGKEVYFWGCGELYRQKKQFFASARPRCILLNSAGELPKDIDGIPVRHPDDVLVNGDILPIVIFVQDVNKIYNTILSYYPGHTDLIFTAG